MVLADSHRLPLIPWYLGTLYREPGSFRLQDFHLLWFHFPEDSTSHPVSYSPTSSRLGLRAPHNTTRTTVVSFTVRVGLGSSPFARHYSGNRYYFFFLGVLRYFNSPCWLCMPMNSAYSSTTLLVEGFPIRTSPGQRLFPPIRRLSQVTTSFIAF